MINTKGKNVDLFEKFSRIMRLKDTICYIRYVHSNILLLYIEYIETGVTVSTRWLFELEWVCKASIKNCFTNIYITEMVEDRTTNDDKGTFQCSQATLNDFINLALPQLIEDKFGVELSDGWHIDGAYPL